MEKLALKLPNGETIISMIKTGPNEAIKGEKLGDIISASLDIVFLIASFLMFIWMLWGIFQYIFAGGNKESLAKARSRITWAIVGFCIVLLSFTIWQYAKEIFSPNPDTPLKTISTPVGP